MELTELCQELKNWFDLERFFGKFEIADGELSLPNLQDGQYFRIVGSVFNDGVYKYPAIGLKNETFDGAVWAMAVPPAVISLLERINAWEEQYGASVRSPYTSESFGGYSYTKSSGGTARGSTDPAYSYKNAFANELNKWRKV